MSRPEGAGGDQDGQPSNSPAGDPTMRRLCRDSGLLTVGTLAAAGVFYVATIRNAPPQAVSIVAMVAAWILAATVPPLWLKRGLQSGAAYQLAVVAWRMGTALPAVAFSRFVPGQAKNYYLMALVVCYLVALLLESVLLVKDAQGSN